MPFMPKKGAGHLRAVGDHGVLAGVEDIVQLLEPVYNGPPTAISHPTSDGQRSAAQSAQLGQGGGGVVNSWPVNSAAFGGSN